MIDKLFVWMFETKPLWLYIVLISAVLWGIIAIVAFAMLMIIHGVA